MGGYLRRKCSVSFRCCNSEMSCRLCNNFVIFSFVNRFHFAAMVSWRSFRCFSFSLYCFSAIYIFLGVKLYIFPWFAFSSHFLKLGSSSFRSTYCFNLSSFATDDRAGFLLQTYPILHNSSHARDSAIDIFLASIIRLIRIRSVSLYPEFFILIVAVAGFTANVTTIKSLKTKITRFEICNSLGFSLISFSFSKCFTRDLFSRIIRAPFFFFSFRKCLVVV